MTTVTQRKKLSKGTWALLIICLAALLAVVVLAAVGIVDLTFLADLVVGYATFGTIGWINGLLIIAFPFAVGMVVCWALYRWFIGQKVTVPINTYVPQGQTVTPTQQQNDTVVST